MTASVDSNSERVVARRGVVASAVVALVIVAVISPTTLLVHSIEGLYALFILAAATLGGRLISALCLPRDCPARVQWVAGTCVGLWLMGALVLALGCAGVTSRVLWFVLLIMSVFFGVIGLLLWEPREKSDAPCGERDKRWTWLWIGVAPFVALILMVSVIPPGVLWAEEAHGYDVLEYHLQLPKEYYLAGRIEYAPHNVYANFPAHAEMLYLLSMILSGNVYDGGMIGQILNAYIGIGVIAAAWLLGRESSPRAGVLTALLAGSAGWMVYLSGIAYVENLMLIFGFGAAACAVRAIKAPDMRLWLMAGFLAGGACCCKYTALPMVAIPLMLAPLIARTTVGRKLAGAGIMLMATFAAFSPWLIKNSLMTGNPVFPLANSIFQAEPPGFDMDQSQHFDESHRPLPDERSLAGKVKAFWSRVIADPDQRIGLLLWVLALSSLLMKRSERVNVLLGLLLLVQLGVWLLATHLYARFAVVLIIPLTGLAGRISSEWRARWLIPVLIAGMAWNFCFSWRLVLSHRRVNGQTEVLAGLTGLFLRNDLTPAGWVNNHLSPHARILLVGEARAYYFNRDVDTYVVFNEQPLAELCPDQAAVSKWLRSQGYSYVIVNWGEIERLRNTAYGFPESIDRECLDFLRRAKTFDEDATGRPAVEILVLGRR